MKDENNDTTEFVEFRAKMYGEKMDGKKDTKKVKGIKNNVVARTITFNDYAMFERRDHHDSPSVMYIRSKLHEVLDHDIRIENRFESIR